MSKVLAFGASSSKKSINKRFAIYAANCIPNAEINVIDLNDFETSEIKITEISHINKINLRINKNNINQMSSCF